jgi:diguanylate cyclase (GGDEF)-like protein
VAARLFRIIGPTLLLLHFFSHFTAFGATKWSELYLYNLIPCFAITVIVLADRISDPLSKPLLITAISLWLTGSLLASTAAFYPLALHADLFSNIAYLLFYPCAMIALPRLISSSQKSTVLEVFDASIVGLGLGVLGTVFVLNPVLPHFGGKLTDAFFALAFPICDLILISLTLANIVAHGFSQRNLIMSAGIIIFTLTDFLFLWQHLNGMYTFGSIIDDGWLLGLLLISESSWHPSRDDQNRSSVNPIFIALSVFLSAILLVLTATRPGYFPTFILFPAISTLMLAFVRMTIALKQTKNIGHERILARTDELTGLPNRRRLISEIESFIGKNGSLLLLDLDGFKPVNDLHGHETGDKVLQQVSIRFARALPHGALLARLGGDEFGVLIEGTYEHSMDIALALRATLSYPFNIDNQHITIGVSIGLAENTGTPDLLRRADDAMYRAKREGLGVCRL